MIKPLRHDCWVWKATQPTKDGWAYIPDQKLTELNIFDYRSASINFIFVGVTYIQMLESTRTMPDIFISYSTSDEQVARFLHKHLSDEGMQVFLASASLQPGQAWGQEILNALRGSSWVLFLASRAACASPWVQQELGGALIAQKKLVPIVWDMPPSELPGWVKNYQALNLAGASMEQVKLQMTAIANAIKSDKAQGLVVVGLLFAALVALGSK